MNSGKSKTATKVPRRDPTVRGYLDFLMPASVDYDFVVTPIFLVAANGSRFLSAKDQYLVRDGLVPLLWFFRQHPKPPRRCAKLWIHESLAPFVPAAWRRRTGMYRLAPAPQRKKRQLTGLIVSGIMTEAYCSLQNVELQLQRLVSRLGKKKIRTLDIRAYVPGRFEGWGSERAHDYAAKYMVLLCRYLGTELQPLTWRELNELTNLEGYAAVELNDRNLCADSYTSHLLASRGALLIENDSHSRTERYLPISPEHGLILTARLDTPSVLDDQDVRAALRFVSKAQTALSSEVFQRFPWPSWFSEWATVAAESKKAVRHR